MTPQTVANMSGIYQEGLGDAPGVANLRGNIKTSETSPPSHPDPIARWPMLHCDRRPPRMEARSSHCFSPRRIVGRRRHEHAMPGPVFDTLAGRG